MAFIVLEESDAKGAGKSAKKRRVFLILSTAVLIAALAVSAVLVFGSPAVDEDRIERILEFGTLTQGISVGDVDLGGMTAEQARAATDGQEDMLVSETKISYEVGGAATMLDAKTVGLKSDYEDVLLNAVSFGRRGGFDDRVAEIKTAKSDGAAFEIRVTGVQADVRAALSELTDIFNSDVHNASYEFMPNGYYEDGTPFDPGKYDGTQKDFSGLVRIPEDEKPNPLRYQYWKKTKYVKDHIPPHAEISRFKYTKEQRGLATDMDALTDMILEAADNADFSTIIVPTVVTEPTVTLEQVKAQTQLISSWTTWYGHSSSSNRAFNVGLLSSMINGTVIEPEQVWSINRDIGLRTTSGGFRRAGAIVAGRMEDDEIGGGVCQVSSTLFNALLRSDVKLLDHGRHSIPSSYMEIGVDAALNYPSLDLKLENNKGVPIFIVAYIDYAEKAVTFEVYGPTVVYEQYGDVILHFSGKRTGRTGAPEPAVIEGSVMPDGTVVAPGQSAVWTPSRGATYADVFIHYLDLGGQELSSSLFYKAAYRSFRGTTYYNPAIVGGEEGAGGNGSEIAANGIDG